ncbi:HTH domain-containing protein [Streptomyces viridosporus]|uniref:HTH domain-containing protein n=1 Tax=Streptomyces viridosporus TaxID=67581 RepID=UPI0021001C3E|nr:HTH domain-containing protein [Streptomyces viridosporus]
METSARLLRLLSLLQAHREWSGADLAERLGAGPRTVRRDVERLRGLGHPVDAGPGTGGGYRLGAGAELPPPLLDDPREPPAGDLAAYVSRGVSTHVYASHAVSRLLVPVEEAAGRISPSEGTLEAEGPDSCVLRTGAASLDVMVLHVMMPGFEFEVREPAALIDAVRTVRDRLARSPARAGASRPRTRDGAGRTPGTPNGSGAAS